MILLLGETQQSWQGNWILEHYAKNKHYKMFIFMLYEPKEKYYFNLKKKKTLEHLRADTHFFLVVEPLRVRGVEPSDTLRKKKNHKSKEWTGKKIRK